MLLEALEYTAMVIAPIFIGAIIFLIISVVYEYFINPSRCFRKKAPRVFRSR